MRRSRNLAARAGRFSARHRRRVIVGWLLFVVLAAVVGGSIRTKTLKQNESGVGESGRADRAISRNFPDRATEQVLVQSRSGAPVSDPSVRAAVADVVGRLHRVRYVSDVRSPYLRGNPGQISRDGRSVLVRFHVAGDEDQAKQRVGAALDTVAAAQRAHAGLRVEEFGDASANKALSKAFEDDFRKAEVTSLPITLLILIVAFGALVAAGVPLLLAISAVAATIGLIGPISHIWAVDQSITSVVLLIGLAVGVDYSMFYLRREREERAAGRGEEAALEAAAGDVGARGPGLGDHRDDRHGRHVHRGRLDLPGLRDRHDPGRGDRGGGLGHRAAGGALRPRRPRQQGPGAVRDPAREAHWGIARLQRGDRTGAAPPTRLRRARRRLPGRARAARAAHPHRHERRGDAPPAAWR